MNFLQAPENPGPACENSFYEVVPTLSAEDFSWFFIS
jgi:hypothetical protein